MFEGAFVVGLFKELGKIHNDDTSTDEEKESEFGELIAEADFDIQNFNLLEVLNVKVTKENISELEEMLENEELAETLKEHDMFEDLQEKILAYKRQFEL